MSFSPPDFSGNSDFVAYAGAELKFLLYGVAGPFGQINGSLELKVTDSSLDLYSGLEVLLGVDAEFFGIDDYSTTVLSDRELLFHDEISQPPPEPELNTIILQPNSAEMEDAFVTLYVLPDGSNSYSGSDTTYLNVDEDYWYGSGSESETFMRFPLDLPSNANIESAKLKLYGQGAFLLETSTVSVRKISSDWNESNVKWDTKPSYGSSVSSSVLPGETTWHEFNITSLVQEWVNGETNYGLALTTNSHRPSGENAFQSSDTSNSDLRPMIEISYYLQQ